MRTSIAQYKLIFCLSWFVLFIIYPSWALHISYSARFIVFSGLIIYFTMSAYVMNQWVNDFEIKGPLIIYPKEWRKNIKNNLLFFAISCTAVVLHLFTISYPVVIFGETLHLTGTSSLYTYIDMYWHTLFDFPIQYAFWSLTLLLIVLLKQKKLLNSAATVLASKLSGHKSNNLMKFLFISLVVSLLVMYFRLIPYFHDWVISITLVRYPPVSRVLYIASYLFFGDGHIGPRLIQLLFYVLSAVYLYRTVKLFCNRETALFAASVYLFSPLVFSHANVAELGTGTIFFINLIAYYFLRYIKEADNRSLLLASYFISIGFLYKRDILLMLFICIAFMILNKIKNKELNLISHLKILLLSLVPIIPWLILGSRYNIRNYEIVWSNLASFDIATSYFLMIPPQISWPIFFLFILSIGFNLTVRRNILTFFFGFIFITYYVLYTADITPKIERYSMIFYPTIAVFMAQFLSVVVHMIPWKHSFRTAFSALTVYLIVLCTVPPVRAELITYRDYEVQYFPIEKAVKWIRDNLNGEEKILILIMGPTASYYGDRHGINNNRIIHSGLSFYAELTPEKLKAFYTENKISHIMFPFGMVFHNGYRDSSVLNYLKEDPDNEFIEIKKFNLGEHYIYIYDLRSRPKTTSTFGAQIWARFGRSD